MSGPDVEGVLAAHRIERDVFSPYCACGQWRDKRDDGTKHRAHVAAAVLAEVRAWLESEGVRGVLADAYDSRPAVESSADSMRAALAALAGQVGQVASVGEGEG